MTTLHFKFYWVLNDSPEVEAYYGKRNRWVRGRISGTSVDAVLEELFERFNHGAQPGKQPEGFRSMSVNDFVTLVTTDEAYEDEQNVETYVCCPQGWQVVPAGEMIS